MAATDTGDPRARSVASVASAAPPPASARTVEAWAEAYIRTTSLERKLRPGPVPARFASDAQARPAIPRRIERPGRPEVFQPPRGKVKYGGLRSGRSRAHLLHRFFGHELQAAELMCWAVLAFPDTPRAFRRGLVGVALDEVRHMNLYATQIARLRPIYWGVLAIAATFTLARFSEAFLILRAQSIGLPLALVPIVLVLMSLAYSLSAYPIGILSDRMDRMTILILGMVLLVLADLTLAFATSLLGIGFGVVLWGLHMGFTQGLFATLIAETAPGELRGTAYGMFNLVTGLMLLAASVIAGALWDAVGPQATFLVGATFTVLTALGLLPVRSRLKSLRQV